MRDAVNLALRLAAVLAAISPILAGTMVFSNGQGTAGFVNTPFLDPQGIPLSGTGYVAQLYTGPTPDALQAVGVPVSFGTGRAAGYVYGGSVATWFEPGGSIPAWVEMRAWEAAGGATYEAAVAARRWTGRSNLLHLPFTGSQTINPVVPPYLIGLRFLQTYDPPLPIIIQQPRSHIALVGSPTTFAVEGTNTLPAYQWRFNGRALSSQTNATLSLDQVTTHDAGGYDVVVSNASGSVTSVVAQLFVNLGVGGPAIVTQPRNLSLRNGESGAFEVMAVGAVPLQYQWYGGPVDSTNSLVAGATNAVFMLPTLTGESTNSGFWVRVRNSTSSVDSGLASLSVFPTNAAKLTMEIEPVGQGGVACSFTVDGVASTTYQLQISSDLSSTNWTHLVDVPLPSSPFTFTESLDFFLIWNPASYFRAIVP